MVVVVVVVWVDRQTAAVAMNGQQTECAANHIDPTHDLAAGV